MTGTFKSIYKNSLLTLVARLLGVIVGFVTLPYIIRILGISEYGLWEVFTALGGIPLLLIASVVQTVQWRLGGLFGTGNLTAANRILSLGILLNVLVVIISFLTVYAGLEFFIPMFGHDTENELFRYFPYFILLTVIVGSQDIFAAVISANRKSGKAFLLKTCCIIIGQLSTIYFLYQDWGFDGLIFGMVVTVVASFLFFFQAIKYWINGLVLNISINDLRVEYALSNRFFFLSLFGMVVMLVRNQLPKILISFDNDFESVANFSIAARLSGLLFLAAFFIMNPVSTEIAKIKVSGTNGDVREIYKVFAPIFGLFSNMMTFVLILLIEVVYLVWVNLVSEQLISMSLILLIGQSLAVVFTAVGVGICTGLGNRIVETKYIIMNMALNFIMLIALNWLSSPIIPVICSSLSWALSAMYFLYVLHKNVDLDKGISLHLISTVFFTITSALIIRFCFKDFYIDSFRNGDYFAFFTYLMGFLIVFGLLYFLLFRKYILLRYSFKK